MDDSYMYVLQQALDKLDVWESRCYMEFNPSKCQVLRVSTCRKAANFLYKLPEQVLEVVSSVRYLGVEISSDLSWNSHIERITTKANITGSCVKRNIKTQNRKVRETSYKRLFTCSWRTGPLSGIPTPNKRYSSLKRLADLHFVLFYQIVYDLVAVPLSDYIQLLNSNSR